MGNAQGRSCGPRGATVRDTVGWRWGLACGISTFVLVGVVPVAARAQQPATTATVPLVFDEVTVVDVEQGKLLPAQRVVIIGNRIEDVGSSNSVRTPKGAQVVNARGKYLISGLWDMHVHPAREADAAYPLFIVNGVTGIRDAGSPVPIDTLLLWRREILAGTRVGPPRQILAGQSISGPVAGCDRSEPRMMRKLQTCVADAADAVRYVDSLKAAGADMIKPRAVSQAMYFVIAAEARRIGLPFGGHALTLSELAASDSGARIIDHLSGDASCKTMVHPTDSLGTAATTRARGVAGPFGLFAAAAKADTVLNEEEMESCYRRAAERFRRNGTWFAPTLFGGSSMSNVRRFGIPLLAGTDKGPWGSSLHEQLASFVASGLPALDVLQSATLNPAKMLHATDSLGTVAPGKLADLVLLDADPLANIANMKAIRAVVANGRYFDRTALDQLSAEARTKASKAKEDEP